MNDQNLHLAAPIAAFTRSATLSGVISLSSTDKVSTLLAVIAKERPDAPQAMLATAASHFADYIGVPLANLKISTIESSMDGFGPYLGKLRKKNGEKLERNSVRSYKNYAQMLLRLAKGLGWSRLPSEVELAWRAMCDAVDWGAITDGAVLRKKFLMIAKYAVACEVPPGKFSDGHFKGYEDLKTGNGRHRKYVRGVISGFRLGITRAKIRDKFPLVNHPLDNHYFSLPVDMWPEPMRSQFRKVINHRLAPGSRRRPQSASRKNGKGRGREEETLRPISGKNLEETGAKIVGFTQLKPELGIDLKKQPDLLDVFCPEVIDGYIDFQLVERETSGRGLSGLSMLCGSLQKYPEYKSVDFEWFWGLISTIPEDDEEAVIDRKSEKYLPHLVLCGIPAKIRALRSSAKKGTVEYAWLVHDELLMTWMPTFAWRQRNVRECSLGTAKRCKNIFKAGFDQYRNIAKPPEVEAELAANSGAEFWQIYFSKDQVKTKQPIRGIVPLHIVPLLEDYLENYRPLLVGDSDPGTLFLNRRGKQHSKESFGNLIGNLTLKHAGRWVSPHLYRDALAHHWLDEHPEDYLTLSKALWHRNVDTTIKRYGHKYDESYGLQKVGGWTGSFFNPGP